MKSNAKKTPLQPRKARTIIVMEKQLNQRVQQHNEAHAGRGLSFLKSFLSNVVRSPDWGFAKPIYHHVNHGDFGAALSHSKQLLTQTYEDPDEHFRAVASAAFVKKYPYVENTKLADENAFRKFLRGERRNRHLNRLLRSRRVTHNTDGDGSNIPDLSNLGLDPNPHVEVMRQYIRRVIGDGPRFSGGFLHREGRWGPGANVGVNGRFTNFARKLLAEEWTVTPSALPYVITLAQRLPMFWEILGFTKDYGDERTPVFCVDPQGFTAALMRKVVMVDYNCISYATKDSDCSRTIAKEPLLNQLVQLAADGEMKLMLRRVGLDLRNQKPNQDMAREGSLDVPNPYCTADMKNASGSIFTELVKELFPSAWFQFFNSTRSPSWREDTASESHKYHGFVSMGNGFCFPLETLIFASICFACHKYTGTAPDFRVYGDDIIIRQNESGVLQEFLRYFGFELNADKSFFFGPFRESCGADWHGGLPVRPVFLHTSLDSFSERIRAHNALARLDNRWAGFLSSCTGNWWPPFVDKFVCPFGTHTDEAIDGRHFCGPNLRRIAWNENLQAPVWFGMKQRAKPDALALRHNLSHVALHYAALSGSKSDMPFTERRETRESVASFSHGGGGSTSLPHEEDSVLLRHRNYFFYKRLFTLSRS